MLVFVDDGGVSQAGVRLTLNVEFVGYAGIFPSLPFNAPRDRPKSLMFSALPPDAEFHVWFLPKDFWHFFRENQENKQTC